jgi:ribosomal protein S18 acetylase RimI-like enzyme
VHGSLPSRGHSHTRLLVTDDRAYDVLVALLPGLRAGMIKVFAAATRCAEFLERHLGWGSGEATAMICRDLDGVPPAALPTLTLRRVCRRDDDPPGGVDLQEAVAVAKLAAPGIEQPAAFGVYLRSLPCAFQLFAAVDPAGTVRATSGSAAFGTTADVIFVNTAPGWRGRGIGHAMTAVALHDARKRGARNACLDASKAGVGIYRRLGFEAVTQVTRFHRSG